MNDLFSNLYDVSDLIGEWSDIISSSDRIYLKSLVAKVNELRNTEIVYPSEDDVFNAFTVRPKDVKVIILGQDPYHNENAMGLAFACKKMVSPSLLYIVNSISKYYIDMGSNPSDYKFDRLLLHWTIQDIMLLNTILSVSTTPLSHKDLGWEKFTEHIIKSINSFDRPIVWMLWGAYAKSYQKFLSNPKHLVLTNEHPAAAARNNSSWSYSNFKACDAFLIKHYGKHINWLSYNKQQQIIEDYGF